MNEELPPPLRVQDRPRRLKLHPVQWVGLPLLFAVPVLALAGVFGESWAHGVDRGEGLALSVEYPARYRYKQINTLQAWVRNTSGRTLDTVTVSFDSAYVSRFSTLMFVPSARIPFEVEFVELEPGEVRRVWLELQGELYGAHTGQVEAHATGLRDTLRVPVHTFIFP